MDGSTSYLENIEMIFLIDPETDSYPRGCAGVVFR
jgi:hypothetical protein